MIISDLKKTFSLFYLTDKKDIVQKIRILNKLIDFFFSVIYNFERIYKKINNKDLSNEYKFWHLLNSIFIKNEIIRKSIKKCEQNGSDINFKHNYSNINSYIENIIDTLMKSDNTINEVMNKIDKDIHTLINERSKIISIILKIMFNLKQSIPIITDISSQSNSKSLDYVKKIVDEFNKISSQTKTILQNLNAIIYEFFDKNNNKSIGYISEKTNALINDFNDFCGTMNELKEVSDNFVSQSISSLKQIKETSVQVKDVAEKVKLISINVRIEASKLTSVKTGFNVLGEEISTFASMTSKISNDIDNKINDILTNIENLKKNYISKMDKVSSNMLSVKNALDPYESIISGTLEKINNILMSIEAFSNESDKSIKDVIGDLIFFDITSQEINHLLTFINDFNNLYASDIENINNLFNITDDEKNSINLNIINSFKKLITTEMELIILDKYIKIFNVDIKNSIAENRKDVIFF